MAGGYGKQVVESEPVEGEPGTYLIRVRKLDRDQLEDFITKIDEKLVDEADQVRDELEALGKHLEKVLAGEGENGEGKSFSFEFPFPIDKMGTLVVTIRDEMTSRTSVKYREFYLELSRELARARHQYFSSLT